MTVISARWQSNMPFQGQRKGHIPMASYGEILSGRLNYYITRWRQEVSQFGGQTRCWQDVVEKASTRQKTGPPGLRLSSPGEQERHNADGHKSGGQYIAVLFGLQLPLTVKPWVTLFEPFQIKWEVYFSKTVSLVVFIVSLRSARICIWLYNSISDFCFLIHIYLSNWFVSIHTYIDAIFA